MAALKSFVFYRDWAFWVGCTAYSTNRWVLKPHLPSIFLRAHFNDVWLIPCALPVVLWLHERFGWRVAGPPTVGEIAAHLVGWSVLFEWAGPHYLPWATADAWDVACYAAGALLAWGWWRLEARGTPLPVECV